MTETSETGLEAQILDITTQLRKYNLPLGEWGTGSAKTIKHLAKEILEGETGLFEENGEIIRRVEVAHLDVRCVTNGVEWQLLEDRQVFVDGRERRRGLTGLSEKMKPGEDSLLSARRALSEELGVNIPVQIEESRIERETRTSPSYPGLKTEYLRHEFTTYLPDSEFRFEGYSEVQLDKTTYFVWKEMLSDE